MEYGRELNSPASGETSPEGVGLKGAQNCLTGVML